MKVYLVTLSESAIKQIKKLPKDARAKITAVISSFELEPKPYEVKKLSGTVNTFRVRVGDYRIIYDIYETEVYIRVLKVGHRKDIYR